MSHKYALIISNGDYQNLPVLSKTKADAENFARVLRDSQIGGFDEVETMIDRDSAQIRLRIEEFFARGVRTDLLLLYFSGHGLKHRRGQLYLAAKDTKPDLLRGTAVSSTLIREVMDDSRSGRQVLVLDCCNSGAFGQQPKGAVVDTEAAFKGIGRGKVILTASDAIQFAWESDEQTGETATSLFTHYLVRGLETGEADLNQNGWITVGELYDYAFKQIRQDKAPQTPQMWSYEVEGELVIAGNPFVADRPKDLPVEIVQAMENPLAGVRTGVISELETLLTGSDKGLAASAHTALTRLADDDSKKVSNAAATCLSAAGQLKTPPPEKKKPRSRPKPKPAKAVPQKKIATSKPILRTKPKTLSESDVKTMLKEKGIYDSSWNKSGKGVLHRYESQDNGVLIVDQASGLTWQQSGSDDYMSYPEAEKYGTKLNRDKFAGYDNWRLPTLEEGMSLMESSKKNKDLYIDPVFDVKQRWIWTADGYSKNASWVVGFNFGHCNDYDRGGPNYVRAVCS